MPTRTYYRQWCKQCNNFELHGTKFNKDADSTMVCNTCDTEYSDIMLGDIPRDKKLEQRARYTADKKRRNTKTMNMFLRGGYGGMVGNPLHDLFNDRWPDAEIHESDAGQKSIDEIDAKDREAAREIRREQRAKELERADQYNALGRNDICICGKLGENNKPLKYKKCCLAEIREIENTRRII